MKNAIKNNKILISCCPCLLNNNTGMHTLFLFMQNKFCIIFLGKKRKVVWSSLMFVWYLCLLVCLLVAVGFCIELPSQHLFLKTFYLETGFCYIAQAGIKFTILLRQYSSVGITSSILGLVPSFVF